MFGDDPYGALYVASRLDKVRETLRQDIAALQEAGEDCYHEYFNDGYREWKSGHEWKFVRVYTCSHCLDCKVERVMGKAAPSRTEPLTAREEQAVRAIFED